MYLCIIYYHTTNIVEFAFSTRINIYFLINAILPGIIDNLGGEHEILCKNNPDQNQGEDVVGHVSRSNVLYLSYDFKIITRTPPPLVLHHCWPYDNTYNNNVQTIIHRALYTQSRCTTNVLCKRCLQLSRSQPDYSSFE